MKKIFLAIAIVSAVSIFSSCSKECKCTTYLNGEKVGEAVKVENESGKKCKDLTQNTVVEINGKKTGVECK